MSLDHVLSRGVWPHCFGWSCEIRWKELTHPELHPKAIDELMPCDFQNDCSGLWCLWHILWIKALRNTNNVLNGNTKVGICKRFRTFRLLFSQELTEMGSCNERSFSVVCMNEMFDPSSDFRSMVSPSGEWCWHQAPVPWPDEGDGKAKKTGNHFDGMFVIVCSESSILFANQHKKPKTIG